jgi:hypothetical protein
MVGKNGGHNSAVCKRVGLLDWLACAILCQLSISSFACFTHACFGCDGGVSARELLADIGRE